MALDETELETEDVLVTAEDHWELDEVAEGTGCA